VVCCCSKNQVSRLQRKATAANPPYKRTERPKDPGLRNIARKNSRQEGVSMNKSLLREFIDMLEAEEASPKKTPQKKKVKSKEQPIEDRPEVDQNYPYQPEPYNF
jgi:ribosomal protein S7